MAFPAVPLNEARIRLFNSSEQTNEQIERCAEIVARAAAEFGFLQRPNRVMDKPLDAPFGSRGGADR